MLDDEKLTKCQVTREWFSERDRKIDDIYSTMSVLLENTEHLSRLEKIAESMEAQSHILGDIKMNLIGPATSKKQMDTETVMLIVKILGAVILALTFTVVFLITGQKWGFLPFHG